MRPLNVVSLFGQSSPPPDMPPSDITQHHGDTPSHRALAPAQWVQTSQYHPKHTRTANMAVKGKIFPLTTRGYLPDMASFSFERYKIMPGLDRKSPLSRGAGQGPSKWGLSETPHAPSIGGTMWKSCSSYEDYEFSHKYADSALIQEEDYTLPSIN